MICARAALRTLSATRTVRARRVPLTLARRSYAAIQEGKVLFTLATPTSTFVNNAPVDSVTLPGLEGEFQVLPNLAPLITEVKPGLVVVQGEAGTQKFFVAGGVAVVHADSTASCSTVECVELTNLDADLAKAQAAQAQLKLNSASNDHDRAVAQIELETATDILAALAAK
jgi:F-type H+-transporting ATPase subunit epsilon